MSSVIYRYLDKIQSRQPINFDALIAKLLAAGVARADISRIFFPRSLKKIVITSKCFFRLHSMSS